MFSFATDNAYSQANILMTTRPYSHTTDDDEYDAVCNSDNDIGDSQDLYTYASTQEVGLILVVVVVIIFLTLT